MFFYNYKHLGVDKHFEQIHKFLTRCFILYVSEVTGTERPVRKKSCSYFGDFTERSVKRSGNLLNEPKFL